jgi:hypothetical protein
MTQTSDDKKELEKKLEEIQEEKAKNEGVETF